LGEVLETLDGAVPLEDITSLGCEHNLTDPPVREEYLRAIAHMVRH